MLLREQELLAEEQAAQAAASGDGSSSSGGSGGGSFGEEAATQTADTAGTTGGSPDRPPGEASEAGAPVGGNKDGESTDDRIPPDLRDGSGDDIVARQLREAATQEEDPALREKLWDEYRAYKNGTARDN